MNADKCKKKKFLVCCGTLFLHNYVQLMKVTVHVLCQQEHYFVSASARLNLLIIASPLISKFAQLICHQVLHIP